MNTIIESGNAKFVSEVCKPSLGLLVYKQFAKVVSDQPYLIHIKLRKNGDMFTANREFSYSYQKLNKVFVSWSLYKYEQINSFLIRCVTWNIESDLLKVDNIGLKESINNSRPNICSNNVLVDDYTTINNTLCKINNELKNVSSETDINPEEFVEKCLYVKNIENKNLINDSFISWYYPQKINVENIINDFIVYLDDKIINNKNNIYKIELDYLCNLENYYKSIAGTNNVK